MSAGELSDQFDVSKPTMSAHFAVLKEADLVHAKKAGKSVIYHLKLSVLEEALLDFVHSFGIGAKATEAQEGDCTMNKEMKMIGSLAWAGVMLHWRSARSSRTSWAISTRHGHRAGDRRDRALDGLVRQSDTQDVVPNARPERPSGSQRGPWC